MIVHILVANRPCLVNDATKEEEQALYSLVEGISVTGYHTIYYLSKEVKLQSDYWDDTSNLILHRRFREPNQFTLEFTASRGAETSQQVIDVTAKTIEKFPAEYEHDFDD